MDRAISASEANRSFSSVLRQVREGDSFVVMARGRPVARIVPVDGDEARRVAAHAALIERLRQQKPVVVGPWTRDGLYDD